MGIGVGISLLSICMLSYGGTVEKLR